MMAKNHPNPLICIAVDEMIAAIAQILEYAQGLTLDEFIKNKMACDAVQHQFEILGEASTHVPFSLRKQFPQIPFSLMYSLRNHIAHEYFDVDYEIIYEIIQVDLKKNQKDLLAMRNSHVVKLAEGE
jgi:uncharacterized protein with HEPN domain